MATLRNANHASQQNTSHRSYISVVPFHNSFFTYSTSIQNLKTVGTLKQVVGATCDTCPAGRILRENGRKLYPDANPDIEYYMVGVYDSVTFLSGYIYPNAKVFSVYNTDRPTHLADDEDSTVGTEEGLDYQNDSANYGPPVLTSGNVLSSDGFVGVQSTVKHGTSYAGSYLNVSTTIVQAGVNYPTAECPSTIITPQKTATLYPNGTIESYNSTAQTLVRLTADGNVFNTGNTSTIGDLYVQGNISSFSKVSYHTGLRSPIALASTIRFEQDNSIVTVNVPGITNNSKVFLTNRDQVQASTLSVRYINGQGGGGGPGTFQIESLRYNDHSRVQFFVIN